MTVQISYGAFGSPVAAKTIDFPEYIYRINPPDYIRHVLSGESAAGIVETLTVRTDAVWEFAVRHQRNDNATAATFKRNLKQWEQWGRNGNVFYVAMDSTETVLTTLSSSPVYGDSSFTVTSPTGIVANKQYVVRNEFDLEVIKVLSVVGSTVNLVEPLNFGFFTGDRFRSELYMPARFLDNRPVLIEKPPAWFDAEFRFAEDLNNL